MDKALEHPGEVYYLNLWEGKDIETFIEKVHLFKNLRKLLLQNAEGKSIRLPATIWSLTKLEYLAISNFTGSDFNGIQNLKGLKYLELDRAGFSTIPYGIFDLQKLEVLNLSDNRLTSLPADIGKLTNLMELELTNNCFTGIPEGLVYLPQLLCFVSNNADKGLVMADGTIVCNNTITVYPEFLIKMKNLQQVHCFFKTDTDPELKSKMKKDFPWIRFS